MQYARGEITKMSLTAVQNFENFFHLREQSDRAFIFTVPIEIYQGSP